MISNFIAIVSAYLIGSIPIGFLLARFKGVDDIRKHGSGNIGATNVARLFGPAYFFLIFFLDAAKAFLFLYWLQWMVVDSVVVVLAAAALLAGNAFSVFLQFRGGKGIATSVGILLALQPWLALIAFVVWLPLFILTRTVGIASMATLLLLPYLAWCFVPSDPLFLSLTFFIAILCLWLHRDNVRRLCNSR